jgi:SAM-dependent methyltransferase
MNLSRRASHLSIAFSFFAACLAASPAFAQEKVDEPFVPQSGQAGKDVVWVPTPPSLVEKMMDHAKVTSQDFVMDLGSGDGRNIIAAAKRGARAVGVEFNPKMVQLSRATAQKEGVADRATFVEGDMFTADISKATVLALFLLPDNLRRLTPKFAELRPGTRLVMNTFGIPGWDADETEMATDCGSWCTSLLYIVPAKVDGTWRLPQGELALKQDYQKVSGTLTEKGVSTTVEGRLRGDRLSFTANGRKYEGQVNGTTIQGQGWTASRK